MFLTSLSVQILNALETTIKSRVCFLVRPILWHLLGLDELHKQMGAQYMGLQLPKLHGLLSAGPVFAGDYHAKSDGQNHR